MFLKVVLREKWALLCAWGGRGSNINDRRNWDSYMVDGEVRRLTPRMQGFPDSFVFPVSEAQAMKQLGNSVAVPAIQATAKKMMEAMNVEI